MDGIAGVRRRDSDGLRACCCPGERDGMAQSIRRREHFTLPRGLPSISNWHHRRDRADGGGEVVGRADSACHRAIKSHAG